MEKLNHISDEEWADVCQFNRNLLDEFIDINTELSPKTLRSYYSNLRIWFVWVKEYLGNKEQNQYKAS